MTEFDYRQFRKQWNENLENRLYRECERLCHEGLGKTPPDDIRGKLYNHLGYLYENFLEDKTFDDILEHYVLSLQVDESNASAHFNLSNFLLEQGMQHLLRALELNEDHKKAQKRLAGLQPLKPGHILHLGSKSWRVEEIIDEGLLCAQVSKNNNGIYEVVSNEHEIIKIGHGEKSDFKNNETNSGSVKPFDIETKDNKNPQNSNKLTNNRNNLKKSNCEKLIELPWIWILFVIVALGGVIAFLYGGYVSNSCKNILSETSKNTISSERLTVTIVLDCSPNGINESSIQKTLAGNLLNDLHINGVNLQYLIGASCDDDMSYIVSDLVGWSDNSQNYISTIDLVNYTQSNSSGVYYSPGFDLCVQQYKGPSAPLLCILVITGPPSSSNDAFTSVSKVNNKDLNFSNMYIGFLTTTDDSSLLSFLSTYNPQQCTVDNGNKNCLTSWSSLILDGNGKDNTISSYCPHCISSSSSEENIGCMNKQIAEIFSSDSGSFVETQLGYNKKCDEIKYYWWLCLLGILPLIILSLIFAIIKCCTKNKRAMNGNHRLLSRTIN